MNRVLVALTAAALLGLAGCASMETKDEMKSEPKAAMTSADQAIAMAEKELKAVKKAGHEWQLIDKATGGSSKPLSKLLDAAKKARDKGDNAEAIRIANRVTENAKLGLEQAKGQAKAGPHYPK
jgi:murein lipoprotein